MLTNSEKFSLFQNIINQISENSRGGTIHSFNLEKLTSFEKLIIFIYFNRIKLFKELIEKEHFINFTNSNITDKSILMIASELNRYRIVKHLINLNITKNFDYIKKKTDGKSAFILALEYIKKNNTNPLDFISFDYLFPFFNLSDSEDIESKEFGKFLNSQDYSYQLKKHNPDLNSLNSIEFKKELNKFINHHLKIDCLNYTGLCCNYNEDEITSYVIYHPLKFNQDLSEMKDSMQYSNNSDQECFYYIKNLCSSKYAICIKYFEKETLKNIFNSKDIVKFLDFSEIEKNDLENYDNYRGRKVKIVFRVFQSGDNGERKLKNIIILLKNDFKDISNIVYSFYMNGSISSSSSSLQLIKSCNSETNINISVPSGSDNSQGENLHSEFDKNGTSFPIFSMQEFHSLNNS